MAAKEQIERILERLEQAHPVEFFRCVDETQAGIGAVLRLLYESDETVTAGRISDVLKISTARVAVLIKKMAAKGLVTKEQGVLDGRVTIVRLTDFGTDMIKKMQEEMYCQIGRVIDAVGEERLLEFLEIADEIKHAAVRPKINL